MEQGLGQAQAQWLPLLQIFLKSASPVGEASHWLHTHTHPHHHKIQGSPALWKFVPHLLMKNVLYFEQSEAEEHDHEQPTGASASSSVIGGCIWIETLPSAMQSSILTFLSVEHARFRKKDLQVLAQTLLANPELDFWVRRAAENLLCTDAGYSAPALSRVDREPDMDPYNTLPKWLEDYGRGSNSLFPWIPLAFKDVQISAIDVPETSEQQGIHQSKQMPTEEPQNIVRDRNPCPSEIGEPVGERFEDSKHAADYASMIQQGTSCISVEAAGSEVTSVDVEMVDQEGVDSKSSLDPQVYAQAKSLRKELLRSDSIGNVPSIAEKMLVLCTTADSRQVLSIIKPWEVDDKVTFQLVQTLLKEQDGYAWSTEMLCSLILPKLLSLREPASRTLVTTVLHAGKVHKRATVDALLLPSMFYKEGLNVAVCEVLHRISKDCLQADHVSSFIQKLFSEANPQQSAIYLPCHRAELSPCLVWSESVFTLFQNILNQKMSLTQDAIDLLVLALDDVAEQFSKSLKFGNFLLCFVSKYPSLLKHHKVLLQRVSERTSTFMTKSIMTKLACL